MNIETKQARLIRALKLALCGIAIFSVVFCMALMFFEYEKVFAFFAQPKVIGVLGLGVGLIFGFTLGVCAMFFATELNAASEKKMQKEFFKNPIIKNGPASQKNRTAKHNNVARATVPQQKPTQKNVPPQNVPSKKVQELKNNAEFASKLFELLDEFSDSDNLQNTTYDVEN